MNQFCEWGVFFVLFIVWVVVTGYMLNSLGNVWRVYYFGVHEPFVIEQFVKSPNI